MDSIGHLTRAGEIKSKPEGLAEAIVDLLKRIIFAVKKVFYILVPVARKKIEVTIIANNPLHGVRTNEILKSLPFYQFNIRAKFINKEEFLKGDWSNDRVLHLLQFGQQSTEFSTTLGGDIHKKMKANRNMKSLLIMPDEHPSLEGPDWTEITSAPHYIDLRFPRAYAQAMKNFVS